MTKVKIIDRPLTSAESGQMNRGFDRVALEEGLEKESSEEFSFVAMEGNTFIGCASGLAYKNGEDFSGWFFLSDLYVDKAYRSQGIGSQLLISLEEKIMSLGINRIWLWTSRVKTLRFYHRLGYTKFTEMEEWYSDGSSRIGLRKYFKQ